MNQPFNGLTDVLLPRGQAKSIEQSLWRPSGLHFTRAREIGEGGGGNTQSPQTRNR